MWTWVFNIRFHFHLSISLVWRERLAKRTHNTISYYYYYISFPLLQKIFWLLLRPFMMWMCGCVWLNVSTYALNFSPIVCVYCSFLFLLSIHLTRLAEPGTRKKQQQQRVVACRWLYWCAEWCIEKRCWTFVLQKFIDTNVARSQCSLAVSACRRRCFQMRIKRMVNIFTHTHARTHAYDHRKTHAF